MVAVVLLGLGSHVTACGPGQRLRANLEDTCDPADRAMAERLVADEVLDLVPEGVRAQDKYTTLPCEDDDGLGAAGRTFISQGQYPAIRAFHKAEFTKRRWELRFEAPLESPGPGELDTTDVHVCFERADLPGVTLGLYFHHQAPLHYWVRFRFGERNQPCPTS
ncbi:hypothetical protein [Actinokineospora terrae]|uniref:Uncharacterized protein n=1 Tax=Actinokineospora terrae TaxID=155974 RepID=A0A1H9X1E8_9PSEU|nr:hypothetical protein [Actinokineospora terrae]SES39996.1 hypothetical protein SAMN04487818_112139 [Actinokineospora terrae]